MIVEAKEIPYIRIKLLYLHLACCNVIGGYNVSRLVIMHQSELFYGIEEISVEYTQKAVVEAIEDVKHFCRFV